MVRGMLTGHVMEAVGKEVFTGNQGRTLVDEALRDVDSYAMRRPQRETLKSSVAVGAALESAERSGRSDGSGR
jgi:hypothetical protein